MSQGPSSPDSADGLQFTTAEPAVANPSSVSPSQQCVVCRQPIVSTYYAAGDKLLCPNCRNQLTAPAAAHSAGRIAKATFMGFGAGLAGAIVWFLVRRVAHIELGLIAILVGYMVGKAIFKGSGNRGGRVYQVIAVLLTYCCIAINYMPDILEQVFQMAHERRVAAADDQGKAEMHAKADDGQGAEAEKDAGDVAPKRPVSTAEFISALAFMMWEVFKLSMELPFLSGANNLIGLLIIGFALWEAWKFTARRIPVITGPYQLGPQQAA